MPLEQKKRSAGSLIVCGIFSLISGFFVWQLINQSRPIDVSVAVPLCFYQVPADRCVQAPEKVTVTLRALRHELACIDFSVLALHVDACTVRNERPLKLKASHLFLPPGVKLVHYEPAPLYACIKNREKAN